MPTVPLYLKEFGEDDVRWLLQNGVRMHVPAGTEVITEEVMPRHVFIVLEGEFRVSSASLDNPDVDRAKAGELLGEISYIHHAPPGASVFAVEDGVLLAILRTTLDAKFAEDAGFKSRFHKVATDSAVDRMWKYPRRHWNPPPPEPEPDPYAELKVHELIEKLLRGEFE